MSQRENFTNCNILNEYWYPNMREPLYSLRLSAERLSQFIWELRDMSLQNLIGDRQHKRLLRLSFPNGDGPASSLLVNSIEAYESLSKPF